MLRAPSCEKYPDGTKFRRTKAPLRIKNCLFKLPILLHLDCHEEFIVEDGKEGKGEEDHSKEIGDEDIIPENHH